MEISLLIAEQIIQLFLMIFVGFIIVKSNILKAEDSKIVSKIVIYLVIPCMIVKAFQIEYSQSAVEGLLFALVVSVALQVILLILSYILGRILRLSTVELLGIYYSNTGNLIVPIISYVLGDEWVVYCCVYMCVQVLFVWTHGVAALSNEKKFNLKKIVMNINVIAVMIGLFLFFTRIPLPTVIKGTIGSISSMVGPLSMIVTGMLLAAMPLQKIFSNKRIYGISFIRLIGLPLIVLLLLWLSHSQNMVNDGRQILLVVFLATITPMASIVLQLTQVYGGDVDQAAAINVMTTLFSIVTIPILVFLFQMVM